VGGPPTSTTQNLCCGACVARESAFSVCNNAQPQRPPASRALRSTRPANGIDFIAWCITAFSSMEWLIPKPSILTLNVVPGARKGSREASGGPPLSAR